MEIEYFYFYHRLNSKDKWISMNDEEFMVMLYQHHDKLTPYIKEMLNGTILNRSSGQYKIIPKNPK